MQLRHSSQVARLDSIFIHELLQERRLFLRVTMVEEDVGLYDTVLQAPLLQLTKEEQIIGLPDVEATKLYIIPVEQVRVTGEQDYTLRLGGHKWLLHYNMNIGFLWKQC